DLQPGGAHLVHVAQVEGAALLHVRQQVHGPGVVADPGVHAAGGDDVPEGGPVDAVGGQDAAGVVVVVGRQAELLEVVGALHAHRGLADLLHRGQQEADEHGDD